jgi:hypothetical protein
MKNRIVPRVATPGLKVLTLIKCTSFNLSFSIIEGYRNNVFTSEFRTFDHKIVMGGEVL